VKALRNAEDESSPVQIKLSEIGAESESTLHC